MQTKTNIKHEISIKRDLSPSQQLVCHTLEGIKCEERRQKIINEIADYISPEFKQLLSKKFLST